MIIVNLYGTPDEISRLRAAANGSTLVEGFVDCATEGAHVRTNSNADHDVTKSRLINAGAKVGVSDYKRDSTFVEEISAHFPANNGGRG